MNSDSGATSPTKTPSAERVSPSSGMAAMLRTLGVLQIIFGVVVALVMAQKALDFEVNVQTMWAATLVRSSGWGLLIGNFLGGVLWFALAVMVEHLHAIRFWLQSQDGASSA